MAPTPEQLAAIEHARTSSNNLAVHACAGSGKTTVLVEMVKAQNPRKRCLSVAFNKSIKEELQARVPRNVDVKTLHGLGYAALQRAWNRRLEMDGRRERSIIQSLIPYETQNRRAVCGGVAKLVSFSMNELAVTPDLIGKVMNRYGVLPEVGVEAGRYVDWASQVLQLARKETSSISFDDQIYLPAVESMRTGWYDAVFFDEAQDANPAQMRLILNAVKPGGKVVIVGDSRQAIYMWRGAGTNAFHDLVAALHADILPLTVTFRCPRRVSELARTIVPEFWSCDDAPEGKVSWRNLEELLRMVMPGEAVISRSNAALSRVCMLLLRNGIRAKIAGRAIGEQLGQLVERSNTSDIKQLLAWLGPYVTEECSRLATAGNDDEAEELTDAAEALRELSRGMSSVGQLLARLDDLFVEDPDEGFVTLRTTHKAKGLQWPRVWMLESTYRLNNTEGENLYYVAATRVAWSREFEGELCLVQLPRQDGSVAPSIAMELLSGEVLARWEQEDGL